MTLERSYPVCKPCFFHLWNGGDIPSCCRYLVAQPCLTLCDPIDWSLPGSSVHGILQARILECVAIPFSRGSSQPRDRTQFLALAGGTAACQASLSIKTFRVHPNPCPLSRWCHPAISSSVVPFSSALNLSQHQGLFQWISSSHQVAKVLSFSFNINPSNEHPGLISFRMDWLDLLAVQGTLKSLLQHLSPKASILLSSAFFTVQLSHGYMTTGKTIALTRRTFVGKITSLLFNTLKWS